MKKAVFEEICTNVHFVGNVRYKRPVWTENDYLTCFGSCPCAFLRCWLRFLGLVNGSAAPLLHPATGHGNGPTLSGLPGHTLQCSLLLLALKKSPAPHPSHFLSAFFQFLVCDAVLLKTSQVHKHCFTALPGTKDIPFFSTCLQMFS